jgi:hypothetical protein
MKDGKAEARAAIAVPAIADLRYVAAAAVLAGS